jgi:hypothetical protein
VRVLIGCEFSGAVREAFRKRGHDAWSCDLLPAEDGSPFHFQESVLPLLYSRAWDFGWEMLIAFPPCTHLCVSGARWFKSKPKQQADAVGFFMALANAPVRKIAIENPVGIMSTRFREPDQIIQPWQFGHGETKSTCLWLKGLPRLDPTNIVAGREARIHKMPPGPNRGKERSRTYKGIAEAMADQWGNLREFELTA